MEITLEKIELVKDRTGVSYKEAKEALEASGGSVVDAIIDIEESIDEKGKCRFSEQGAQIVEKIKELIKKGNISKIVIKKDGEILLNLPVNIGVLGAVFAPWAMIAGTIAAFGTKCVVELIKDDGAIIDISEMTNETIENLVEKGSALADEVKIKSADAYQNVKEKTSDALNKMKKEKDEDACDCDCDCDNEGCCCDEENPSEDKSCGCQFEEEKK